MMIIPSGERVSPLYAQYLAETLETVWRPCDRCQRRRTLNLGHGRWVECAPGQSIVLILRHVRCRRCHTVETVFPPWLLPYESLTVEMMESMLTAIEIRGESLETVAAAHQVSVERVQALWHRWRAVLPEWPYQVEQEAAVSTAAPLVDTQTWQPPATARSASWAWLQVAWQALALLWGLALPPSGWVFWRTVAPECMPATPISAHCHLGQRLRQPRWRAPPTLPLIPRG